MNFKIHIQNEKLKSRFSLRWKFFFKYSNCNCRNEFIFLSFNFSKGPFDTNAKSSVITKTFGSNAILCQCRIDEMNENLMSLACYTIACGWNCEVVLQCIVHVYVIKLRQRFSFFIKNKEFTIVGQTAQTKRTYRVKTKKKKLTKRTQSCNEKRRKQHKKKTKKKKKYRNFTWVGDFISSAITLKFQNLILRFHFIDVLFAVWRAVECKSLHICQLHNGIFNCIVS